MSYKILIDRISQYIKTTCILCLFLFTSVGCGSEDYDILEEEPHTNSHTPSSTNSKNQGSKSNETDEINMLTNGGLEEWSSFWTPEMPKGWSLPSNEYVIQNRTIVYEGNSSAKMQSEETGNTARLEQKIQVVPHEKIRIRFHYFIEQWKSKGARTYCYFRTRDAEASNISTDDLNSFYDKDTYYIIRGGGQGLTYFPYMLNVWQLFDETIEVPPTAYRFVFGINSYYGTTIYIDDCWIIDVTENVSTSINPVTM